MAWPYVRPNLVSDLEAKIRRLQQEGALAVEIRNTAARYNLTSEYIEADNRVRALATQIQAVGQQLAEERRFTLGSGRSRSEDERRAADAQRYADEQKRRALAVGYSVAMARKVGGGMYDNTDRSPVLLARERQLAARRPVEPSDPKQLAERQSALKSVLGYI